MCRRLPGARPGSEEEAPQGSHWDLLGVRGQGRQSQAPARPGGPRRKNPLPASPAAQEGRRSAWFPGFLTLQVGNQPRPCPRTLSCCWVWPGAYRRRGRPPGPGTAGCGGTWRRPAGSSVAGARAPAPAPAPDPAPAPGPAPALSLLWDTKERWALAPQPEEEQPNTGRARAAAVPVCAPALPGSRTAVEGKPGVRERCQDRSRGGASLRTEGGGGHRAFSHDTSLGPHHQGLTSEHCCLRD